MLKDANPHNFAAIYIICGRTDMRYGIDSLAAIIDSRYHLPMFVPNTLFLFCGHRSNKIKGLVWEGDGFLLFTKRVADGHLPMGILSGPEIPLKPAHYRQSSSNGL